MTEPEIMTLCIFGFILLGAGVAVLTEELSKRNFLVEVYEFINGSELTHLSMTLRELTCPDIKVEKYENLRIVVITIKDKTYRIPCQNVELIRVRATQLDKSKNKEG